MNYTVTVASKDSSTCTATGFNVSSSLAGGLTQTPASWTLNLSPGQSQSQIISVTSPVATPEGFYALTEKATNAAEPSFVGSATANYTVMQADIAPPTVSITSPQSNSTLPTKGNVSMAASATDASGIASIVLKFDESVLKTCTNTTKCSARLNANSIVSGAHIITATATDKSPNGNSASTTITVTK